MNRSHRLAYTPRLLIRAQPLAPGHLPILQKGLEWSYILLCFALIWYAVSLVSGLWHWLRTRRGGRQAVLSSAKLLLVFLLARGVIWLGVMTSTS